MVNNKLNAYQQVSNQSAQFADPHRLIQMLMDGFIMRVAAARGAMQRREFERKGVELGKAISILSGLRDTLDHDKGGELAANLEGLYDYMQRRILEATASNDVAMLDEIIGLMREVKTGWDGIRDAATGAAEVKAADPNGVSVSG
ncbi:flagellar protein FliS [Natronocella acetinitrilica]|uniref:Flagellar secretion chaperone FliS n=1 Tax=Natronocella acetinitrilica TaxID=414046 RepID=A0AAE3G4D9_9GAMM|nr:flagellar export chaperone FliS [Natronocella acetinitrilica]MCP1675610.1 flagellar protein FliS [Natronocella acetinitrilica]